MENTEYLIPDSQFAFALLEAVRLRMMHAFSKEAFGVESVTARTRQSFFKICFHGEEHAEAATREAILKCAAEQSQPISS